MQGELLPRECVVEVQQDVLPVLFKDSEGEGIIVPFCGTRWGVIEVTPLELEDEKDEDGKVPDGVCDFNNERILINKDLTLHRKRITLCHELLHVIYDYLGVEDDEELVRQLEHHIYALVEVFPCEYKSGYKTE